MKRFLFLTKAMGCGGVETTLLNLFKSVDYEQISIDLYLLKKKGEFLSQIPHQVNVYEVEMPEYIRDLIEYCGQTKTGIKHFWKQRSYKRILILLIARVVLQFMGFDHYKQWIAKHFRIDGFNEKNYDVICDYHGYSDFTTIFCSNLNTNGTKCTWIHDENIAELLIQKCYLEYDYVFGVSKECCNNYKEAFNCIRKQQVEILHNAINRKEIIDKSNFSPTTDYGNIDILSVGRLTNQKGFDLAIQAATLLRERGLTFKWVIIGEGSEKDNLAHLISKNNLEDTVILHGFDNNPYSYMKKARLYVQSSRHEGFATTITEAIVLGKAIVSTKVSGITEQVVSGHNGFVVNFDSAELADAIEQLLKNDVLLNLFEQNSASKVLGAENPWNRLLSL